LHEGGAQNEAHAYDRYIPDGPEEEHADVNAASTFPAATAALRSTFPQRFPRLDALQAIATIIMIIAKLRTEWLPRQDAFRHGNVRSLSLRWEASRCRTFGEDLAS